MTMRRRSKRSKICAPCAKIKRCVAYLNAYNMCLQQFIAHDALSGLINLADNLAAAKHMVDKDFLIWLISYTAVSALVV